MTILELLVELKKEIFNNEYLSFILIEQNFQAKSTDQKSFDFQSQIEYYM